MGSIYGNTQTWMVRAFNTDGRDTFFPHTATFEGERAFTQATELLDQLKVAPGVMEVAVMRMDGGEPKYVERSRRNERGEWAAIPFSQDYPMPAEDD
jgi:hypothetical protein